jgi:predicted permease
MSANAGRCGRWVEGLWADVRYGGLALLKRPGFLSTCTLTLAIAVGANTAVVMLVAAAWFRAPAVGSSATLLIVRRVASGDVAGRPVSAEPVLSDILKASEARELAREESCFSGVAIESVADGLLNEFSPHLAVGSTGVRLRVKAVGWDYFRVLGVPVRGRGFTAGDDKPGADPVVVISSRLWRERFGAEEAVIGRHEDFGTRTALIVGVAEPRFDGVLVGDRADAWLPFGSYPHFVSLPAEALAMAPVRVFPRLAPGCSDAEARTRLRTRFGALTVVEPLKHARYPPAVERQIPEDRDLFALLGGTALCVLLAGWLNLVTLMVVRADRRRAELLLRSALGASPARLGRLLVIEAAWIGSLGAVAALVSSHLLLRALSVFALPSGVLVSDLNLQLDWMAAGFTVSTALVSAIVCGAWPAVTLWGAVTGRAAGKSERSAARSRAAVLAVQVSFSLVLLVGAFLLTRSVQAAFSKDWGFAVDQALFLVVQPRLMQYPEEHTPEDSNRRRQDYERLLHRLRDTRGVRAATMGQIPLGRSSPGVPSTSATSETGRTVRASIAANGPGYLTAVGIPLVAGRDLAEADLRVSQWSACVVSVALAEQLWPKQHAVGARLTVTADGGHPHACEVIGVAGDAMRSSARADVSRAVYVARPLPDKANWRPMLGVVVGTTAPAESVIQAVREATTLIFPNPAQLVVTTIRRELGEQLAAERFGAMLFSCFGAAAYLICLIGTYGLSAYALEQRQHELAVRLALGAQGYQVRNLVLRTTVRALAVGAVVGAIGGVVLGRVLLAYLFEIGAWDPVSHVAAFASMVVGGGTAAVLGVHRVIHLDPASMVAESGTRQWGR